MLEHGLLQRDVAARALLLSALAGEHLLLIGPPGTAKSELARRLQRLLPGTRYFERLLTRFSVPEELFGPLSLQALEAAGHPPARVVPELAPASDGPCELHALGTPEEAHLVITGHGPEQSVAVLPLSGAALTLEACTVVGKLHAAQMSVSNSILLAALAEGDSWAVPVRAARKQVGCVRFSWLPLGAIVPTRFRCQPGSASDAQHIAPRFTSLVYGTPAYAQLARSTPPEVLRGADDESEMGVFHHLHGAQREANLRIRLAEYLRVGLRAGIFYES